MARIWIVGAGRFGLLALKRLSESKPDADLVCVDAAAKPGFEIRKGRPAYIQADGAAFLATHLREMENGVDWIVPAVPVHLAAGFCLICLAARGASRIAVPGDVVSRLPHPMVGESGDVYTSHADFICPDDCAEPARHCTHTGKPREQNLFELLGAVHHPGWRVCVLRSHQLAPGVGGYRPSALIETIARLTRDPGDWLVGTACRCHGVLTGIRLPAREPGMPEKELIHDEIAGFC